MKQLVKVLFASGSEDLIPTAIEHMRALYPEIPLVVVSEFPPSPLVSDDSCRWIPYHVRRTFRENWALCRSSLKNNTIRLSAVILQPRMPYWRMRAIGFLLSPLNFLAFNEAFGHFMLRPGSVPTMARHLLWRIRNLLVWELSPGGATFTLFWRVLHPKAIGRPLTAWSARLAGGLITLRKAWAASAPLPEQPSVHLDPGVSVIIPSRKGHELLARMLPRVVHQLAELKQGLPIELIVIDNGSEDDTPEFLQKEYPGIRCVQVPEALSFARAINTGLALAKHSHVCMLNNDMLIAPFFFESLWRAFERLPGLFCATAQIFLPEGVRREETGKAVMCETGARTPTDFPIRCDLPISGEDHTYVLYGSGGCSMFDTKKLRQLGGLDPTYEPAYVEDLDLGVRAWQQNWPSVFVSDAQVVHAHRATTSRYYSAVQLKLILELNYLKFLVRAVSAPQTFRRMWGEAIRRLNLLAARQDADFWPLETLKRARGALAWWNGPGPTIVMNDEEVFAIGSGSLAVFRGANTQARPVILIASPYLPFPLSHGGAVRMYNLMCRAAPDFDQVLISFVDDLGPLPQELLSICVEVVTVKRVGSHARPSSPNPDVVEEFGSPVFRAVLHQTVRKWGPAIAQLEFTQMAQYAIHCAPARTLLVEHDITFDLVQQMLGQREDWELRQQLPRWIRFEQQAWRNVDAVITMSEKDRVMVDHARAVSLPNGVDVERFRPGSYEPELNRLLFIGSFAHFPNIIAIEFFLREVWPRLRPLPVKLHLIAGARHRYHLDRCRDRVQLDLCHPEIEIEDFVTDVRPAYQRATLVIAPLLASAGTNIKIMEAMAMGKAIVSTSAGINGLDLKSGHDVIVSDTADEMAAAIAGLLVDGDRRRELERHARATAEEHFDWNIIAKRQRQIYNEVLAATNENK